MHNIDDKLITRIIHEEIRKFLLKEYALERSDFMDSIKGISKQIIIHWCLIRFSQITNFNSEYIPHWKHELKNWLFSICEMELKKNNAYKKRYKAIFKLWNKYDFNSKPNVIRKIIFTKFINEKIDMKSKEIEQVINDFIENANNIINLLAIGDVEKINEYVENL